MPLTKSWEGDRESVALWCNWICNILSILTDMIILEHWISQEHRAVFGKYELWWCIILFKLSSIEIISWSGKTLHLIFLKCWVGHFFIWKELIKLMEIWEVTLLNKKWGQDLTANVIYISGCDWLNDLQNKARKGQILRRFLINSIYKTIPLLLEVRFSDGKVEKSNHYSPSQF